MRSTCSKTKAVYVAVLEGSEESNRSKLIRTPGRFTLLRATKGRQSTCLRFKTATPLLTPTILMALHHHQLHQRFQKFHGNISLSMAGTRHLLNMCHLKRAVLNTVEAIKVTSHTKTEVSSSVFLKNISCPTFCFPTKTFPKSVKEKNLR